MRREVKSAENQPVSRGQRKAVIAVMDVRSMVSLLTPPGPLSPPCPAPAGPGDRRPCSAPGCSLQCQAWGTQGQKPATGVSSQGPPRPTIAALR